eukprot:1921207-Pyramimonas_sp.AAC.1
MRGARNYRGKRVLLEALPLDDRRTVPTPENADNSVLVTVAEEQRWHLPAWGYPCDSDITETYRVPLFSRGEDDTYGLDSDEE